MGKLIRCITSEGAIMATCVDTTDVVAKAEKYHNTSAVVTAALGRLLTAASMMGNMLKSDDQSLTLRIMGEGKIGNLVAASDFDGNVRGYVTNPIVEIPLNAKGKLDVGGAVGAGTLYVIKDLGMKEPYVGQIPLTTGEIAEDITSYYAISEQIPTICALGVLVNPDLTVNVAGGFIIQMLPGFTDAEIDKLEDSVKDLEPITKMLSDGKTPEEILRLALKNFEVEVLYEQDIEYKCKCSRERTEAALISIGIEDLKEMAEDEKDTEVCCHFCDKKYIFTKKDLEKIISKKV
ncbi:MAG: Hsp33 family molecular chaperone HslO [Clostridia bacterium]|nr:Hsp33 family molecular chaperone HslO [Clostridia bacterium]